ncbi:MAG: hypothetical protein GOMPHAMPRED_006510 [Gomphillus americanus]|uniref:Uncharacterized protein n=1 Tax=Gomphillus americanus TaxID=1940652 RepID=A0A8H3FZQ7_9LECA|nr:MAG: hypothetical protein GOMPHAMPRED_006510 [Gomphillus americanus]
MSISRILSRAETESFPPISTEEIQHAFQRTRPQARRKRTASSFVIAEDLEEDTRQTGAIAQNVQADMKSNALASVSIKIATGSNSTPGTDSSEGIPITQPRKSLRSRNMTPSTNLPASLGSKSRNIKKTTKSNSSSACYRPATSTYPSSRKVSERIPLGVGQNKLDEPNVVVDRAGSFTGKENIPPDAHQISFKRSKIERIPITQKTTISNSVSSYTPFPEIHDQQGSYAESQGLLFLSKSTTNLQETPKSKDSSRSLPSDTVVFTPTAIRTMVEAAEEAAEEEMLDDYEDQGIVLVNIINLPSGISKTSSTSCQPDLKALLQRIYGSTYCNTVLQKVGTSIRRGNLHPYNAKNGDGLQRLNIDDHNADIQRQFIDLWVNSYELLMPRAALETVVDKEIRVLQNGLLTSIQRFLESHIVEHKDARKSPWSSCQDTWAWEKAMHRSLALILLMDQAKLNAVIPGSLFQATSTRRSSLSIWQDFATLLWRSHSGIIRVLKVLGYKVAFSQDTWLEYNPHCKNVKRDIEDEMRANRRLELVTDPLEHDSSPPPLPTLLPA